MNRGVGRLVSEGQRLRRWVGVLGGLACWLILGATGLGMLRAVWIDYALAEPNDAYATSNPPARHARHLTPARAFWCQGHSNDRLTSN